MLDRGYRSYVSCGFWMCFLHFSMWWCSRSGNQSGHCSACFWYVQSLVRLFRKRKYMKIGLFWETTSVRQWITLAAACGVWSRTSHILRESGLCRLTVSLPLVTTQSWCAHSNMRSEAWPWDPCRPVTTPACLPRQVCSQQWRCRFRQRADSAAAKVARAHRQVALCCFPRDGVTRTRAVP